jgi:hypothetical protein
MGSTQAILRTARTARQTAAVTSKPIENSMPWATMALTKPWVAPADSARTSMSTPFSVSPPLQMTGS